MAYMTTCLDTPPALMASSVCLRPTNINLYPSKIEDSICLNRQPFTKLMTFSPFNVQQNQALMLSKCAALTPSQTAAHIADLAQEACTISAAVFENKGWRFI